MTENFSLFQHDDRRVLRSCVVVDEIVTTAAKAMDHPFDGCTEFHAYTKPRVPEDFGIGLIVGPSGSGKSTLLRDFGNVVIPTWDVDRAIVSHFVDADEAIEKFGAVGLNSVPAWLRPYHVLSTGQQFRANLARQLTHGAVIDEFTSVVDRAVAQAASRSMRRYVSAKRLQGITVATCHYDVMEWLEPDWVFDCGSGHFEITRGRLRRPLIEITIHECGREIWPLFAPHHYLSADLLGNAKCFAAFYRDRLVGFSATTPFPHGAMNNAVREHRTVVLPDFQGLGIGPRLSDAIAEWWHSRGLRFYSRTAHPRLAAYRLQSDLWAETTGRNGKPPVFTGKAEEKRLGHKFFMDDDDGHRQKGLSTMTNRAAWSFLYIGATGANAQRVADRGLTDDLFGRQ